MNKPFAPTPLTALSKMTPRPFIVLTLAVAALAGGAHASRLALLSPLAASELRVAPQQALAKESAARALPRANASDLLPSSSSSSSSSSLLSGAVACSGTNEALGSFQAGWMKRVNCPKTSMGGSGWVHDIKVLNPSQLTLDILSTDGANCSLTSPTNGVYMKYSVFSTSLATVSISGAPCENGPSCCTFVSCDSSNANGCPNLVASYKFYQLSADADVADSVISTYVGVAIAVLVGVVAACVRIAIVCGFCPCCQPAKVGAAPAPAGAQQQPQQPQQLQQQQQQVYGAGGALVSPQPQFMPQQQVYVGGGAQVSPQPPQFIGQQQAQYYGQPPPGMAYFAQAPPQAQPVYGQPQAPPQGAFFVQAPQGASFYGQTQAAPQGASFYAQPQAAQQGAYYGAR